MSVITVWAGTAKSGTSNSDTVAVSIKAAIGELAVLVVIGNSATQPTPGNAGGAVWQLIAQQSIGSSIYMWMFQATLAGADIAAGTITVNSASTSHYLQTWALANADVGQALETASNVSGSGVTNFTLSKTAFGFANGGAVIAVAVNNSSGSITYSGTEFTRDDALVKRGSNPVVALHDVVDPGGDPAAPAVTGSASIWQSIWVGIASTVSTLPGAVALAPASTLTVGGVPTILGVVSETADTSLTGTPVISRVAAVSETPSPILQVAGFTTEIAAASLHETIGMSIAGTAVRLGAVTESASAGLSSSGIAGVLSAVNEPVTGTLVVGTVISRPGAVIESATAALVATGVATALSAVAESATAHLSASAIAIQVAAVNELAVASTLVSGANLVLGDVLLSSDSMVQLDAGVQQLAAVELESSTTEVVDGAVIALAAVQAIAVSTLSADSLVTNVAAIAESADTTAAVTESIASTTATVTLAVNALMTELGLAATTSSVTLVGEVSLALGVNNTALGVIIAGVTTQLQADGAILPFGGVNLAASTVMVISGVAASQGAVVARATTTLIDTAIVATSGIVAQLARAGLTLTATRTLVGVVTMFPVTGYIDSYTDTYHDVYGTPVPLVGTTLVTVIAAVRLLPSTTLVVPGQAATQAEAAYASIAAMTVSAFASTASGVVETAHASLTLQVANDVLAGVLQSVTTSLTTHGTALIPDSAQLHASASLDVSGSARVSGSVATLTAHATLTSSAISEASGVVAMHVTNLLSFTEEITVIVSVAFIAHTTVMAMASPVLVLAAAALEVTTDMTADALVLLGSPVSMAAITAALVDAQVTELAAAMLVGVATLTPVGIRGTYGVVQLAADVALQIIGIALRNLIIDFSRVDVALGWKTPQLSTGWRADIPRFAFREGKVDWRPPRAI